MFETTSLLLKFTKGTEVFKQIEALLIPSLNHTIVSNITDMNGYAFQIYSLFVANSTQIDASYSSLSEAILNGIGNWGKDMRYLIPALGQFLTAMIFKYPEFI